MMAKSEMSASQNITVGLVDPFALVGDRFQQVDVRIGKVLRVNDARATVSLDVYNLSNSSAPLGLNGVFGGSRAWQAPQAIMQGRLFKLTAQFDF